MTGALSVPLSTWLLGCSGLDSAEDGRTIAPEARRLTLGAYTTPREAYGRAILPAFAEKWRQEHGEEVTFEESYQASGAQARAVIEGFEADVVALSLEPDIATLEAADLVTSDWRALPHGGMVSRSVVVIAVRPGNPKGITGFRDLARSDVEVLTPNVRTSGGAMWNVAALYGAALRGKAGAPEGDEAAAEEFLARVLGRVTVMDKGARESIVNFEKGIGDAAITYENEVIVAKAAGAAIDYVIPSPSILIENPAAVVDRYAAAHGNRELARAFVEFLHTPEAQAAYADYGLRSVDPAATQALPPVSELFTVADLGGWDVLRQDLFAEGGIYDRALARAHRE